MYLCHLSPIEEVFHHQQVQFLFGVVLGVLVADTVHSQNLSKCCGALLKRCKNSLERKT